MAKCPRCAAPVPAYTRCDGCGLVLGFDGITVLIEFEDSAHFRRVSRIAHRQDSCSEWTEENGCHFLRVTYSLAELGIFCELAAAAVSLSRKHSFLNGLEIRWPAPENGDGFSPEFPRPVPASMHQNGRSASPSH
ncbi:MAG TPA: hypothetical protein VES66_05775 [Terriglobales bacterium]|nr:hypothetical protein [Terriglobales bacterium]